MCCSIQFCLGKREDASTGSIRSGGRWRQTLGASPVCIVFCSSVTRLTPTRFSGGSASHGWRRYELKGGLNAILHAAATFARVVHLWIETIISASPSTTTVSPTVQTVVKTTRFFSGMSSLTVTRAVTVSPTRTGALNLRLWLT